MAFDNVTLFEVNLPEEALKGGSRGKQEDEQSTQDSGPKRSTDSKSGGRSKGKLALVVLALAGVAFGVRKLRSGGSDEEFEMEYESPGVEVEAETEQ